MAHGAKQIRDWFVTALTGYGSLPTINVGAVRQVAAAPVVHITMGTEEIEASDVHIGLDRLLGVDINIVAATYDAIDALCVDIEKGVALSATAFPGRDLTLVAREYSEDTETELTLVECVLRYAAEYTTDDDDPETIN